MNYHHESVDVQHKRQPNFLIHTDAKQVYLSNKCTRIKVVLIALLLVISVIAIYFTYRYYQPKMTTVYHNTNKLKDGTQIQSQQILYTVNNLNSESLNIQLTVHSMKPAQSTQAEILSLQSQPSPGMIIKKTNESVNIFIDPKKIHFGPRLLTGDGLTSVQNYLVGMLESQTDRELQGSIIYVRSYIFDTYGKSLIPIDQQQQIQPSIRQLSLVKGHLKLNPVIRAMDKVVDMRAPIIPNIAKPALRPPAPPSQSGTTVTSTTNTNSNVTTNIIAPINVTTPINVNVSVVLPSKPPSANELTMLIMLRILKYCTLKSNGLAPVFDCPVQKNQTLPTDRQVIKISERALTK